MSACSRPDFAAPHWLVELLRSKPVPVPWNMVARAVLALATPLAVAYAAGDIGVGALVSTGALPAVLSEAAGPYRYRARRLGGATLARRRLPRRPAHGRGAGAGRSRRSW